MKIVVDDDFDGGNIKFVKHRENANGTVDVVLEIKPDVYTELESIAHMQYFSFRVAVSGLKKPAAFKYILANADKVSYPEAWAGTSVFYSTDLDNVDGWKRKVDTFYTESHLWWEHVHVGDETLYFSYFPPFSQARHDQLIADCRPYAEVQVLGKTAQGRNIECIITGKGDLKAWIIHRQHPGETMAEHYAEGLLQRLLGLVDSGRVDKGASKALEMFTFYIVPCMCPDGSRMGHLRTNSAGANLNREWTTKGTYQAPTLQRSPEVYCVLNKMDETGVDVFVDVHGDEELPYNFISGANLIPNWGPRMEALHGAFTAAYSRTNSDMQQAIGYPPPESAKMVAEYMNVATNQVAQRFDCLAVTLEMPFKDCRSNPDPERGWSPARSRKLGASVLEPLMYVHPFLRATEPFWDSLPTEDAYVATTDDYLNEPTEDEFVPLKKRFYSDVHEIHKAHP